MKNKKTKKRFSKKTGKMPGPEAETANSECGKQPSTRVEPKDRDDPSYMGMGFNEEMERKDRRGKKQLIGDR